MTKQSQTLTLKIRASGYIELLTLDGAWVGPGVGGFRNIGSAHAWAALNSYEVVA